MREQSAPKVAAELQARAVVQLDFVFCRPSHASAARQLRNARERDDLRWPPRDGRAVVIQLRQDVQCIGEVCVENGLRWAVGHPIHARPAPIWGSSQGTTIGAYDGSR